jgi:DNA-directed RNA polymerase subunit beta'
VQIADQDYVEDGQLLATGSEEGDELLAKATGYATVEDGRIMVLHEERREREFEIPITSRLAVINGQTIKPGDMITEGSKNPHEVLAILGVEAVRDYLVVEVQKVYRSQGVSINDKHIEVIIRQMLRRVRVLTGGDTEFLPDQLVDRIEFEQRNEEVMANGGEPATAEPIILGITKAALNTDSFLSAASFQHTISVLANAAIEGKVDELRGLKESVLIGKLIPAGTGFHVGDAWHRDEAGEAVGVMEGGLDQLDSDLMSGFGANLFGGDAESELDSLDASFLRALRGSAAPISRTLADDADDGADSDFDDDDGLDLLDDDDTEEDENDEDSSDLFEE